MSNESKVQTVGYVKGSNFKKQKSQIFKWCSDNEVTLNSMNTSERIYDLLLNLKKGDAIIVSSLSCLSQDAEELASIMYACRKNEIDITSIKEGYFLDLTSNEYNKIDLQDGFMKIEHFQFLAHKVLSGDIPVKAVN